MPPLLTYSVSVAVLITLSSIPPCNSPKMFVYLLGSDLLLALRRSILHCLIRYALHYFSHSPLKYFHYTFLFYFGMDIISLRDVSLRSYLPRFFSTCLHSNLIQYDHPPHLCLLRSACSTSDILNYDCCAHALICLL